MVLSALKSFISITWLTGWVVMSDNCDGNKFSRKRKLLTAKGPSMISPAPPYKMYIVYLTETCIVRSYHYFHLTSDDPRM